LGLFLVYNKNLIAEDVQAKLPVIIAVIGLVLVLKSFTERKHARMSWLLVIMNHFWVALAVAFNQDFSFDQIHLYLSGVAISGVFGYFCLHRLKILEGNIDLDQLHGHSHRHRGLALAFLVCALGAAGFPITPSFIGEDLILTHINENQTLLAFIISVCLILDGIAIIRIYARVFLGPHAKSIYEMSYRSS
jgi:NADH:ubiquinone oxidoreductase subunit 2 (subunit N)